MNNPHPHLNLTAEQLTDLRESTRARIQAEYAGDKEAYFDAVGATAYALTAQGWKRTQSLDSLTCAITDRELLIDADEDWHDADGPFKYVNADGRIWYSEYDQSDEAHIDPQIGTCPFTRVAPGPDAEPVLVTTSFDYGGFLPWPEAWWFDRRTARKVVTTRIDCDHRVDYESEGAQDHPELEIWQTGEGLWVGRYTDPEAVCEAWADEESLWCALDERYVAHALYCADQSLINLNGPLPPLVALVRGLRCAADELGFGHGTVGLDSDHDGTTAQGRRYHSTQAAATLRVALRHVP